MGKDVKDWGLSILVLEAKVFWEKSSRTFQESDWWNLHRIFEDLELPFYNIAKTLLFLKNLTPIFIFDVHQFQSSRLYLVVWGGDSEWPNSLYSIRIFCCCSLVICLMANRLTNCIVDCNTFYPKPSAIVPQAVWPPTKCSLECLMYSFL